MTDIELSVPCKLCGARAGDACGLRDGAYHKCRSAESGATAWAKQHGRPPQLCAADDPEAMSAVDACREHLDFFYFHGVTK